MTPLLEFHSKIDTWFTLLFWGGALGLGAGAVALIRRSKPGALIMGIVAVLFAGVSFTAQGLKYVIGDDGIIRTRGGLLPGGPIADCAHIRSITPSTDSSSAPAASLDRLRIDFDDGHHVLISPEDKAAFEDAVASKNPRLHRSGDELR